MNTTPPIHPAQVLFADVKAPPGLSACEHFAGTEERITQLRGQIRRLGAINAESFGEVFLNRRVGSHGRPP